MYRDLDSYPFRKEPREPERKRPKLTPGQQKVLLSALAFELFLLFVAPIGGSSIIDAVIFLVGSH